MKIRIQVVIETESGKPEKIEEIARLERGLLRPEELGLRLPRITSLFSIFGRRKILLDLQLPDFCRKQQVERKPALNFGDAADGKQPSVSLFAAFLNLQPGFALSKTPCASNCSWQLSDSAQT